MNRVSKIKCGTFAGLELDPDAAAVAFNDPVADGEADAGPRVGLFLRRDTLEYLENLLEVACMPCLLVFHFKLRTQN